jgi:ABC-type branched-subunit amino acid transport system substrate-binding protein
VLVATLLVAAVACVTALAGAQADPGVTARTIKVGATFPLSGRAAYYAPIAVGMKAYFSYINARRDAKTHKRGVNGRQIIWTYYDDGYNPANTAQQTRKLVEEDKVFALFGGLGTEPQQAVVDYLNSRKVPQMFVSTGATEFDANYKSKPYTLGWQPDYEAEGRIYGKYAAQTWPTKKIAVLYQNDDYGKNYLDGLRSGLGSRASNIIMTQGVAATDTSVASQIAAIRQSGADVIAIFATPGPTIIAYGTMKALRYRPEEVILNSVSANEVIMKLALASADAATINGSISVTYQKDPASPTYANDASIKLYKRVMAKYAPNTDANSSFPYYGVAKAWDVVRVLQLAGKNPTRAKVLKIVKNMNWVNPFLLPGVKVKTSANDPFPVSQVKLIRYNNGLWTEFGSLIDGRGGT